ncbi:FAD-linked oxidase C-terminal domain-containing protein [Sorangium sp. So ce385]
MHHPIKDAFDPDGILNPGKVLGPRAGAKPGGDRA